VDQWSSGYITSSYTKPFTSNNSSWISYWVELDINLINSNWHYQIFNNLVDSIKFDPDSTRLIKKIII